jgi:hypothetical protein
MSRRSLAILAPLLLLAACNSTTASLLPGASGVNPSALASAALGKLCTDADPASLASIAGQLDAVGTDTDTTAIEASLGTLLTSLQGATVSATVTPLRDAAVTAVTQAQTSIKDPGTKQQAARQTAVALRALETAAC